jgi:hypothetical protein
VSDVENASKEAHRPVKPITAKPAEHLLCTMGEEDDSQDEAKDGPGTAFIRSNQFLQHCIFPFEVRVPFFRMVTSEQMKNT